MLHGNCDVWIAWTCFCCAFAGSRVVILAMKEKFDVLFKDLQLSLLIRTEADLEDNILMGGDFSWTAKENMPGSDHARFSKSFLIWVSFNQQGDACRDVSWFFTVDFLVLSPRAQRFPLVFLNKVLSVHLVHDLYVFVSSLFILHRAPPRLHYHGNGVKMDERQLTQRRSFHVHTSALVSLFPLFCLYCNRFQK